VHGSAAAQRTSARGKLERQALGERILLTVVVLALLAACLTLVAAPWAPERAEAAAELFFGVAAPPRAVATQTLLSRRETGSGAHLAGSPVSIALDRAAAAD
jgi:predicted MFS family arabinose efflux permease